MSGEREKTSGFVIGLSLLAAMGGFLFGYDTGVISGAMILLVKTFNLNPVWQEVVVSVTVGAAALFALAGGIATEKFGRRPVIIVASLIFTVGAVLMAAAPGAIILLCGRFTVGAGIGESKLICVPQNLVDNPSVGPIYLYRHLLKVANVAIANREGYQPEFSVISPAVWFKGSSCFGSFIHDNSHVHSGMRSFGPARKTDNNEQLVHYWRTIHCRSHRWRIQLRGRGLEVRDSIQQNTNREACWIAQQPIVPSG